MKLQLSQSVRFRTAICGCFLLCGIATSAMAQEAMFKCTSADGRVEYTNKSSVDSRTCVRLNIEPPAVVPAPRAAVPAASGASGVATASRSSGSASTTPPSFPRVDGATQRARDSDRKRILEEELQAQEARLADMRKVFNNGEPERQGDETRNYQKYLDRVQKMKDDMARMQGDIASVRSELSKIQ